MHVVGEGPFAVDLDDRQPFAIASFELLVAPDVDLTEVEVDLGLRRAEDVASTLAEVATVGVIQDDRRRYG